MMVVDTVFASVERLYCLSRRLSGSKEVREVINDLTGTGSVLGQSKILTDNFSTCTDRLYIYLHILSMCYLK